jgi:hypothetical protein
MTAYEIQVDENSGFQAPLFNHVVNTASTAYTLDLRQDDDSNLPVSMQDYVLDWNATYFWRVKVKDNKDTWSGWLTHEFKTLQSSPAYAGFDWEPQEPNINEVVTFIPDDLGALEYSWIFTPCQSQGNCLDPIDSSEQSPELKLLYPLYLVELTTDDTCTKEQSVTAWYPLPIYKEVSPSLIFNPERLFSVVSNFFKSSFWSE